MKRIEFKKTDWRDRATLPPHSGAIRADVGLRIYSNDNQLHFTLLGPLVQDPGLYMEGVLDRELAEIVGQIINCRNVWMTEVIHRSGPSKASEHPFQDAWNLEDFDLIAEVAPRLAVSGQRLFNTLFRIRASDELKRMGALLREVLSVEPRCIAVTSADVFVPWNMLYTHPVANDELNPDGSNWKKEGFWGYSHIIQQDVCPSLMDDRLAGSPIISVNFDDRLSTTFGLPQIQLDIDEICRKASQLSQRQVVIRKTKAELQLTFSREKSVEPVVYLFCHGRGTHGTAVQPGTSVASLVFRDGDLVAEDVEAWMAGDKLRSNSLIFINSCHGGAVNMLKSNLYQDFGTILLRQGASGVVGPQFDVPAVFASEYGRRILSGLFSNTAQPSRLGAVMRQQNQLMWDRHRNPLGLAYSLYRGMNCYVD